MGFLAAGCRVVIPYSLAVLAGPSRVYPSVGDQPEFIGGGRDSSPDKRRRGEEAKRRSDYAKDFTRQRCRRFTYLAAPSRVVTHCSSRRARDRSMCSGLPWLPLQGSMATLAPVSSRTWLPCR